MQIEPKVLRGALNRVARAVQARSPITEYQDKVLLRARDEVLEVAAYDSGKGLLLRYRVPCYGEDLEVLTTFSKLVKVVGARHEEYIGLDVEDDTLILDTGAATVKFETVAVDRFPQLAVPSGVDCVVTRAHLEDIAASVGYASAGSNTFAQADGFNVTYNAVTATDLGAVMAVYAPHQLRINAIIPRDNLRGIIAMLDDGEVRVSAGNWVWFNSTNASAATGIFDGEPMDFSDKYADTATEFSVGVKRLTSALEQALLFADDSARVYIDVSPSDKTLTLRSMFKRFNERIECEAATEHRVCINGNLLLNALKTIDADMVLIGECAQKRSTLMLRSEGLSARHAVAGMEYK